MSVYTTIVLVIFVMITAFTLYTPNDWRRSIIVAIYVIAFVYFVSTSLFHSAQANYSYISTRCEIVSKTVTQKFYQRATAYVPILRGNIFINDISQATDIQLNVDDNEKLSAASAQALLDPYQIGRVYPCWYNPDNPIQVVLQQGWYTGLNNLKMVISSGLILAALLIRYYFQW